MYRKQNQLIQGKCWVFGDDINTDVIIPTKYLQQFLSPAKLAEHILEVVDDSFSSKVTPGDILVVGNNFGCGSSREEAVIGIKALGISAILGESFARIFYRNAVNNGVLAIECPGISELADNESRLQIDLAKGMVSSPESGKKRSFAPPSAFLMTILEKGGLVAYYQNKTDET